jgi:hypothetical protein
MINSWILSHSQRRTWRHLTSLLLRRSGMFSFGTDLGIVEAIEIYYVTKYYKKNPPWTLHDLFYFPRKL